MLYIIYQLRTLSKVSVQQLKLGKSDGEEGLNSEHIKHGPRILYVLLTLVFNSMLVYGNNHDSIVGTMVPMPKDKRQHVHQTTLELLLLVTLLPNCLMLLYYLKNNVHLQHCICNLDLYKICPLGEGWDL